MSQFFFFIFSRKRFLRGFVSTFPSAYTVFFSEKKKYPKGSRGRIKIIVAVSKSNKVK